MIMNIKSTVSLLIGAFLTTGLLYVGIPAAAEEIRVPEGTVEWSEDVPEETTGWFDEIPDPCSSQTVEEISEDVSDVVSIWGAELTEEGVYQSLISMKSVYPEGMTWTNDNFYSPYYHYKTGSKYPVTYTGYGCAGFVFHLSNVAFGDLPDREHYDWDDIRVGDILRINNNSHSVIVLGVDGDTITVAEGNYNSIIHWGRRLSRKALKGGTGTYIWTRWPEGSTNTTVTSITMSPTFVSLKSGQSYTLSVTVYPSTATDKSVTYSSSDSSVATVDSSGKIQALKSGTSIVTCISKQNSSVKATCTVQVVDEAKIKAFVSRLYAECHGRNPDTDGLNYWVTKLVNGSLTGADVGREFVFSNEYIRKNTSNDQYVEMLYNVFMDRQSDAEGKAYWIGCLEQGLSREYLFRGFAQSSEYLNICSSYGITRGSVAITQARDQKPNVTKYACRLYTQALGRTYDPDGLNYWCKAIINGAKTPQVAAEAFINSPEFQRKNLSNEDYIKVLYRTFMGREYDNGGLQYWIGEMNKGRSRQYVLTQFANSPEFKRIQASFGL